MTPPEPIRQPSPTLPPDFARYRYSNNLFVFEGVLDETGQVRNLRTIQAPVFTPPNMAIEGAYRDALMAWIYKPAELYGKPVPVFMTWRIGFNSTPPPQQLNGLKRQWVVEH